MFDSHVSVSVYLPISVSYSAFMGVNGCPQSSWFDFNDSTVTPIEVNQISNQFGGNKENAYMLFYRRRGHSDPDPTVGDPAPVLYARLCVHCQSFFIVFE